MPGSSGTLAGRRARIESAAALSGRRIPMESKCDEENPDGGWAPAGWSDRLDGGGAAGDVPLIPREVLFGNPERAAAAISPDGTQPRLAGAGRRRAQRLGRAGRRPRRRQAGHRRQQPRHPHLLLGLRQPAHPLPPGHGRRRELARLRVDLDDRQRPGPDAVRQGPGADRAGQPQASRTRSWSASTTATRSSTTSTASTSRPASASSCRRTPGFAGFVTDDDYQRPPAPRS